MNWIKDNRLLTGSITLASLAAFLIKYYYYDQNKLSKFNEVTIDKIIIYPIKACKGISLKSCKLNKYGFENDRRWLIVKNNRYVALKPYPVLALVEQRFSDDGKFLIVSKEGMEDLKISMEPLDINKMDKSRIYNDVTIIDSVAQVYDEGDEAAEWFSRALSSDGMRLCQMCPSEYYSRAIRQHIAENVDPSNLSKFKNSLSNSCQIMVLGQSSIDLVNKEIENTRNTNNNNSNSEINQKYEPMTWSRYRPNLLLSGTIPFQEDDWKFFKTNKSNVTFTTCDYNARCPVVLVNEKGIMDPYNDEEPLRTLRLIRSAKCKYGDKVLMGVYVAIEDKYISKVVSVGETLTILENGFTSKFFNKSF